MFLLGWVYLFFASLPVLGVAVSLLVFVFVILVDNVFARLKWQTAIRSAWLVTLVLGFGNILMLSSAGTEFTSARSELRETQPPCPA